jgi:hypothetical protein
MKTRSNKQRAARTRSTTKTRKTAFFIFLTIAVAVLSFRTGKAIPTTIQVHPSVQTVTLGDTVTVDIDLDFAENLSGYDVSMSFSNSVLSAVAIEHKGYLEEPTFTVSQEVNSSAGYVRLVMLSLNTSVSKTGGSPPPLATATFTAIGIGTSDLHLYGTKLSSSNGSAILHETLDGQVTCNAIPEFSPDIALPIFLIMSALVSATAQKCKKNRHQRLL